MRQVFVNFSPGLMTVPSGMVTSETNEALSQAVAPPPNEGVELPKATVAMGEGGGKVGNGEGEGVLVGGVRASCVACWASRVWKAAVKMASTLSVGVASALLPPQAVRTRTSRSEGTRNRRPSELFILRIDQSPSLTVNDYNAVELRPRPQGQDPGETARRSWGSRRAIARRRG